MNHDAAAAAAYWDREAPTFDDEVDHGLRDPAARKAWKRLLRSVLPPPPADVADLGAGTGSLACLLAEEGFAVRGLDISPRMVNLARAKARAAGLRVDFDVGDAFDPLLPAAGFEVVLVRHVLWAMPDTSAAVERWARLVRPGGRLVLVEGHWHTGGGLTAEQTVAVLREHLDRVELRGLPDPELWGGPVEDERYVAVARVR
jgi:ubiquinone/menaquinone biosynthesis C-methylase UbiE